MAMGLNALLSHGRFMMKPAMEGTDMMAVDRLCVRLRAGAEGECWSVSFELFDDGSVDFTEAHLDVD